MSMKYGISHHNFGPYPGEDADAVNEGLQRLVLAATAAGFEAVVTTERNRFVRIAFPHHTAAAEARFDSFIAAYDNAIRIRLA